MQGRKNSKIPSRTSGRTAVFSCWHVPSPRNSYRELGFPSYRGVARFRHCANREVALCNVLLFWRLPIRIQVVVAEQNILPLLSLKEFLNIVTSILNNNQP